MIGIYRIVNKVNGKCYVGQSIDLEKRIHDHFLKSNSKSLQQDMESYGEDNFYGEILAECSIEDQNRLEREFVAKFRANDPNFGYNIHPGGGHKPGYRATDETRKKMRDKRLELINSPDFVNGTAGSKIIHRGNVQSRASGDKLKRMMTSGWELGASQAFKDNLSHINSGENNPAYGKGYKFAGENNHFFGKHHTEETKQKIREHMPDTSYNWRGKHHSEESRAKMRGPRPSVAGENNHNYGKRGEDSYLYGYKAVYKGDVGKRVKPEDLQRYLDDGWTLGNRPSLMTDEKRKMYGEATKGRKMMNKDGVNTFVKSCEFDKYLSDGWVFGRVSVQKGEHDA